MDPVAHHARRDQVAFDELAERKHAGDQADPDQILELERGDGQTNAGTDRHAQVWNEREEPCEQPDDQAVPQADQPQPQRIEQREKHAHHALTADEAGEDLVALVREAEHGRHVVRRDVAGDARHHAVPVAQHVEGDDRRDEQQRHDVEQSDARLQEPGDGVDQNVHRATPVLPQEPLCGDVQLGSTPS